MTMKSFILFFLLFFPFAIQAQSNLGILKKESYIQYTLTHPMHVVVGKSSDLSGVLRYNTTTKSFVSTAIAAPVRSFDSGNGSRDSHMLEVVEGLKFPRITFTSNEVRTNGENLNIKGNLTFHGITKPVSFTAKTWTKDNKIYVQGKTEISLTAFSVEKPSFMMVEAKDELKIEFRAVFQL
ncbi:MAG TPA: YceI family protein [Bacteroidetes bacterium]|mgnify:CR=1 FL=1|nr:YceI family protein [Bacteroidota bacterium]